MQCWLVAAVNSEQGFSNARATATRCACPTERRAAWSPTGVSTPCGRSGRNSLTQALSSAACSSCSLASGRASSTLSRNVAAGNCGFCPTQERCLRHDSGDKSRNSIPLIPSDQPVLEALNAASLRQTTLMVTHQLEDLADWDVIWVMQDGRIIEQGRYAELSVAGGPFATLLAHRQEEI